MRTTLEHTDHEMFAHSARKCKGQVCCLHNRTQHSLRGFPQHWRADRQLMERTCPHGVGHPDPDHMSYLVRLFKSAKLGEKRALLEGIHGCDGCCGDKVESIHNWLKTLEAK